MTEYGSDYGYTSRSRRQIGEQWDKCSRCGFAYPFSQLRRQSGDGGTVLICIEHCYDEPSYGDYRSTSDLPTEQPLKFVDEGGPSG